MIVRMSKVMIVGPRELMIESLDCIQQLGIMQVEEEVDDVYREQAVAIEPEMQSQNVAVQQRLLLKLKKLIEELLACFESVPPLQPGRMHPFSVHYLLRFLPIHLDENRRYSDSLKNLERQLGEYEKYKVFIDIMEEQKFAEKQGNIRFAGIRVESSEKFKQLEDVLEKKTQGKIVVEKIAALEGGEQVGIIGVGSEDHGELQGLLKDRGIEVFSAPADLDSLPIPEQSALIAARIREYSGELEQLRRKQGDFSSRWLDSYQQTLQWIDAELSLYRLTASMVKTRWCFFIFGWIPVKDFEKLRGKFQDKFRGKVLVEESEMVEKDFSRIPTALHNPAYFEPFELFTRLLPMPPYASFDMTPFLGIFFPIFFGMMLGDMGYGVILLVVAVLIVRKFRARRYVCSAGKILFISSAYTIFFGGMYGELLGTLGHEYLGLKPVLFDRQSSLVPMLFFAVAAGVVHVVLGLVLGIIASIRRKMTRETVFKLLNVAMIIGISTLAVAYLTPGLDQIKKPLVLTIVIGLPVLLLVGGFMAPLELLKNIGNIISYARIMAVGLTSVLLAYVANYMAGRIGSVWAGILVALLLHAFNICLGIFGPTLHAIRLHYVEFLSKYMEPGGREFKPLGKK